MMAEQVTANAGATEQNQPAGDSEPKTFTQDELDEIVKKRVAKEKAKYADYDKLKADAAELSQLREANKTELEKANDRAAKAAAERDALLAEKNVAAWKQAASEKYGVPVDVLAGNSEEEIEQHAQTLEPYFKQSPAPVVSSDGRMPATSKATPAQQFGRVLDDLRR